MKKILALALTLVMLFALCAAAAYADDALVLKIGVSTADTDPRNIAAQSFADEIAEKTNGAVTAQVYPAAQLGSDSELINSIALDVGTVDIVISDASNFGGFVNDMNISALPFLFSDFDEAWAFMDGEIEAAAEAKLLDIGMRVLAHYDNGFRCVTNSRGPIETPDDMKNLLIRYPDGNRGIQAALEALGANPQPLPFGELYQALQQKTYDAQENPIPVIYNNKLYEVQEFLSVTNHVYSGMCFAIAESTWNKLTAEQQEIVAEAALASAKLDRETNRQQTNDLVANLEAEGMKVNYPDLAPFAEATKTVIENNVLGFSDDLIAMVTALKAAA